MITLALVFLLATSSEPMMSLVLAGLSVWWLLHCVKERE